MRRLQFLAIALVLVGVDAALGEEPAASDLRFERLEKKRAELRILQQEIAALQRELGVADGYQVRCLIGEIPIDKLHQLDVELQVATAEGRTEKLTAAELFGISEMPADSRPLKHKEFRNSRVDAKSFQRFLDALKAASAVTILADPIVAVEPGQSAKMHSGGQFPIPLPTPGKETDVEWRKFGIMMETKVVPVERNIVYLLISAEHAERDFANAVNLNGEMVPGLRTSRIQTESRMALGQTLLLGMATRKSVRFFAVTPSESAGSTPKP